MLWSKGGIIYILHLLFTCFCFCYNSFIVVFVNTLLITLYILCITCKRENPHFRRCFYIEMCKILVSYFCSQDAAEVLLKGQWTWTINGHGEKRRRTLEPNITTSQHHWRQHIIAQRVWTVMREGLEVPRSEMNDVMWWWCFEGLVCAVTWISSHSKELVINSIG